jgi:hypothetical protein
VFRFRQVVLGGVAAITFAGSAQAQSDNPAENRTYIAEAINELAGYLSDKCGNFPVVVKLNDVGFDYNSNPTKGTPSTADRVTAGLLAVIAVCEAGEAESAAIKAKFKRISIVPGTANTAQISKQILTLTFDPKSSVPVGQLRDQYYAQLK